MSRTAQYVFLTFAVLAWLGMVIYFHQTGDKKLARETLEGGAVGAFILIFFGGFKALME